MKRLGSVGFDRCTPLASFPFTSPLLHIPSPEGPLGLSTLNAHAEFARPSRRISSAQETRSAGFNTRRLQKLHKDRKCPLAQTVRHSATPPRGQHDTVKRPALQPRGFGLRSPRRYWSAPANRIRAHPQKKCKHYRQMGAPRQLRTAGRAG